MADPTSGLDPQAAQPVQGQQPTDALGKIGAFFAHPAVQGALAAYLGAIGSPRYMGWGGALSRGGLAGLQQYGQAERFQQLLPLEQAKAEAAKAQALGAQAKAQAYQNIGKTDPGQEQASLLGYGGEYYKTTHQSALAQQANQQMADQFLLAHPNDPIAAQLATVARSSPRPVSFGELMKGYSEAQLSPIKLKQAEANLTAEQMRPDEIKAQTERARAGIAESTARMGHIGEAPYVTEYGPGGVTKRTRATAPDSGYSFAKPESATEKPAAPAIEYGPGGETKRTRSLTPDTGYSFTKPASAAGQLAKINTDLGRFVTANPLHFYTTHGGKEQWVKDATDYAAAQNPGIDRGQIEQAARALGRVPASGGASTSATSPGGASGPNPDDFLNKHMGANE